jgi:SPP1 family predicted phage head-tail adaptor
MRSGPLNRRITIQRRANGQLADGQPVDTWQDVATVWANIGGRTGLRAITTAQDGVPSSVAQYSFRIRYRTDITADMRVFWAGQPYAILLVQSDHASQETTDLVCQFGGKDG